MSACSCLQGLATRPCQEAIIGEFRETSLDRRLGRSLCFVSAFRRQKDPGKLTAPENCPHCLVKESLKSSAPNVRDVRVEFPNPKNYYIPDIVWA